MGNHSSRRPGNRSETGEDYCFKSLSVRNCANGMCGLTNRRDLLTQLGANEADSECGRKALRILLQELHGW